MVDNMDRTNLIYNRTKHSPNNQSCSHANGDAWNGDQYVLLLRHGDDEEPYVAYGVLQHGFYVRLRRVDRDPLVPLDHVDQQKLVLPLLKNWAFLRC